MASSLSVRKGELYERVHQLDFLRRIRMLLLAEERCCHARFSLKCARPRHNSVPHRHVAGFRRAMLDRVAGADLMAGDVNPFAGWHEGIDGDYQTIFIQLWAYLADILTFYQERFANEAFVTTATQRDSLLHPVRLIDYRPSPGSGASALVTFTVSENASLSIPAGFRVGSRAQSGRPAAVFETAYAITASGDNSAIRLSSVSPDVDFFRIRSLSKV